MTYDTRRKGIVWPPLTPAIGFKTPAGLVLRYAAHAGPPEWGRPALLFELDERILTVADVFAEVTGFGEEKSRTGCESLHEALRMLLHAADRTIGHTGFGGFGHPSPAMPCPVCSATTPPPGARRPCVLSELGLVVCRGEPCSHVAVAKVAHSCGGQLFIVGEPALSRVVIP